MTRMLIMLVRLYRYAISPFMASRCIYYPSCSSYAVQALEEHGWLHGSGLVIRRLLRCRPFAKGGYDPVPEKKVQRTNDMKEQQ